VCKEYKVVEIPNNIGTQAVELIVGMLAF